MGLFNKVFGKSKGKKSSTEKHRPADPSDHGNESEPEEHAENDNRSRWDAPEGNNNEENSNRVASSFSDRGSPARRHSESNYQPWSSSYGTCSWQPTGYQREDYYPRDGYTTYQGDSSGYATYQGDYSGYATYQGDSSGYQNWGSFFGPTPYTDQGVSGSSGQVSGYDNYAGTSGQVNNYYSPPRMHQYDEWNRGHYVKSDHDVLSSEYWQGLFEPPRGGWS